MTRTHYYARSPRGFSNEIEIIAQPADQPAPEATPAPGQEDWQAVEYERISRETALAWGRADGYVTVTPRDDGNGALSRYAEDHPGTTLAHRVAEGRDRIENGEVA